MKNRVTEILGTQYPLIQAPMTWNTSAELVAAVGNAGGLGVLGPNAGQTTLTNDAGETGERMRQEIRKTKQLTDKNFALNILSSGYEQDKDNPYFQVLLDIAFEENVKYFAIVGTGEINKELFKQIKAHGGVIIYRPSNPTTLAMKNAEQAGADILVATGYDEGGGLPAEAVGTFTLIPTIVDAVTIPVMAAGGIVDKRGVQAAFALGAEGVYMGTRFLATQEAPTSMTTKQAMVNASLADLKMIFPGTRSVMTKTAELIMDKYKNGEDFASYVVGGYRIGMLEGNLDEGILSVATSLELIKDIPTVEELMTRLFAE